MKIPNALIKKIGSPQRIFRALDLDGVEVLVRLQKPWEEEPDDVGFGFKMDNEGKISPLDEDDWMEYGTCIIVEAWSDATQSIVTQGIRKSEGQSDEEFAFGARYLLNNGTDAEWLDVLRGRKIDKVLKMACRNSATFVEPTVKPTKKKKT